MKQPDIELDLTPMIDVIFLLIIFFILAGKITSDISNTEITVPPTKTGEPREPLEGWKIVKVETWGDTQERARGIAKNYITIGTVATQDNPFTSTGSAVDDPAAFDGYIRLREVLDTYWGRAEKYQDEGYPGLQLPKIIIELRADADTEYRVVQEIQQVMSDTISTQPDQNGRFMRPKDPEKPFVKIRFTTRIPEEEA
jgi:biopolymer transport protein ExbD